MKLPAEARQLLAYLGVASCGLLLVVGLLAALFEDAAAVRLFGALTALAAAIVGGTVGRRVWIRAQPPDSAAVAQTRREPVDRQVDHPQ